MNSTVKATLFAVVILVSAIALWNIVHQALGYRVRESVFVAIFVLLGLWAIRMTIAAVRHEERIAKIERGLDRFQSPPQ